jgi:hypothetical protein
MLLQKLSSLALLGTTVVMGACSERGTQLTGEPGIDSVRRLSESEYLHTIHDIFGKDIEVIGRFEPNVREHGLNAIGSSNLTITPSGFEQYYAIAASVTEQALDNKRAQKTLGCTPEPGQHFDQTCATDVIQRYGRQLFRRALADGEAEPYIALAQEGANTFSDFNYGMRLALSTMMSTPDFLFRVERTEIDPDNKGSLRLDSYAKATRLSHFLWNTAPDDELLTAAENGSLHTDAGVQQQIARMIDSPKLEDGVRALFTDMLHLDDFANVSKDGSLYPKFSQLVLTSAKEETLLSIVDHLLEDNGDYRELFTMQETYINRPLAAVYKTRYLFDKEWSKYTFPEEEKRSGILSQVGFLTLHSHPGESSPTLRGVAVNEIFRCTATPDPPANVDFSIIQDVNNPELNTRRKRLEAHATDPACAGCHTNIDPLGLPLDRFDALGQARPKEDGELIDVSLAFKGRSYDGAPGLGQALAKDPQVANCFVNHVYGFATGRWARSENGQLVEDMYKTFADGDYKLRHLFSEIALHDDFFKPIVPERGAENANAQTVKSK